VGTDDFQAPLSVIMPLGDALLEAGRQFELKLIPGAAHSMFFPGRRLTRPPGSGRCGRPSTHLALQRHDDEVIQRSFGPLEASGAGVPEVRALLEFYLWVRGVTRGKGARPR
jgi:hypothetical protein